MSHHFFVDMMVSTTRTINTTVNDIASHPSHVVMSDDGKRVIGRDLSEHYTLQESDPRHPRYHLFNRRPFPFAAAIAKHHIEAEKGFALPYVGSHAAPLGASGLSLTARLNCQPGDHIPTAARLPELSHRLKVRHAKDDAPSTDRRHHVAAGAAGGGRSVLTHRSLDRSMLQAADTFALQAADTSSKKHAESIDGVVDDNQDGRGPTSDGLPDAPLTRQQAAQVVGGAHANAVYPFPSRYGPQPTAAPPSIAAPEVAPLDSLAENVADIFRSTLMDFAKQSAERSAATRRTVGTQTRGGEAAQPPDSASSPSPPITTAPVDVRNAPLTTASSVGASIGRHDVPTTTHGGMDAKVQTTACDDAQPKADVSISGHSAEIQRLRLALRDMTAERDDVRQKYFNALQQIASSYKSRCAAEAAGGAAPTDTTAATFYPPKDASMQTRRADVAAYFRHSAVMTDPTPLPTAAPGKQPLLAAPPAAGGATSRRGSFRTDSTPSVTALRAGVTTRTVRSRDVVVKDNGTQTEKGLVGEVASIATADAESLLPRSPSSPFQMNRTKADASSTGLTRKSSRAKSSATASPLTTSEEDVGIAEPTPAPAIVPAAPKLVTFEPTFSITIDDGEVSIAAAAPPPAAVGASAGQNAPPPSSLSAESWESPKRKVSAVGSSPALLIPPSMAASVRRSPSPAVGSGAALAQPPSAFGSSILMSASPMAGGQQGPFAPPGLGALQANATFKPPLPPVGMVGLLAVAHSRGSLDAIKAFVTSPPVAAKSQVVYFDGSVCVVAFRDPSAAVDVAISKLDAAGGIALVMDVFHIDSATTVGTLTCYQDPAYLRGVLNLMSFGCPGEFVIPAPVAKRYLAAKQGSFSSLLIEVTHLTVAGDVDLLCVRRLGSACRVIQPATRRSPTLVGAVPAQDPPSRATVHRRMPLRVCNDDVQWRTFMWSLGVFAQYSSVVGSTAFPATSDPSHARRKGSQPSGAKLPGPGSASSLTALLPTLAHEPFGSPSWQERLIVLWKESELSTPPNPRSPIGSPLSYPLPTPSSWVMCVGVQCVADVADASAMAVVPAQDRATQSNVVGRKDAACGAGSSAVELGAQIVTLEYSDETDGGGLRDAKDVLGNDASRSAVDADGRITDEHALVESLLGTGPKVSLLTARARMMRLFCCPGCGCKLVRNEPKIFVPCGHLFCGNCIASKMTKTNGAAVAVSHRTSARSGSSIFGPANDVEYRCLTCKAVSFDAPVACPSLHLALAELHRRGFFVQIEIAMDDDRQDAGDDVTSGPSRVTLLGEANAAPSA